jgi:endoglucanase
VLLPLAVVVSGCGAGVQAPAPSSSGATGSPPAPTAEGSTRPDLDGVLQSAWAGYRHTFIEPAGRVVDPQQQRRTTSEGQSYAMLRSAWLDDRQTFATVWDWTRRNLRVGSGAFGYLWGQRGDGSWGLIDNHSATDGDQDIALALLIAARRWGQSAYEHDARDVITAIWNAEVATLGGKPYVTAGDWATTTSPGPTVNVSYFAPYAYTIFARVDSAHRWQDAVDTSYRVLDACTSSPLAEQRSAGLPPNWCVVDAGGIPHHAAAMQASDDYGYDAFRVMWRLAVAWQWDRDSRARDFLQRTDFLRRAWHNGAMLASVYAHDGSVRSGNEDVAVYGGDVGNFLVTDGAAATAVVEGKLLASKQQQGGNTFFADAQNYYDQNWVWFGLALAAGRIQAP